MFKFEEHDIPDIIEKLEKDIAILREINNPLETNKDIELLKYYINYINIQTVCSPFREKKSLSTKLSPP